MLEQMVKMTTGQVLRGAIHCSTAQALDVKLGLSSFLVQIHRKTQVQSICAPFLNHQNLI